MHTTTETGFAAPSASADSYPVREYVAAMARELAQMARWDGDETLSKLLDGAAEVADRPTN